MSFTHLAVVIGTLASFGAALGALILIQTTAVLTVGLVCTRALRRRSAAVQSAWHRIILTATILTPCASALAGLTVARVHVALPVRYSSMPVAADERFEAAPAPTADRPSPKAAERSMTDTVRGERPARSVRSTDLSPAAATQSVVHGNEPAKGEPELNARPSWLTVTAVTFCTAWLLIAAIRLGRLNGAILGAMRLIRTAVDADPQLAAHCRLLARDLGVRPPALKRSPFVSSACVFGWRRPVIVLPESDAGIGDDVLIHELAHVVRRDCLWNLLAECAVAILWLQPLLWRLKSRMQECAEEVCDDYVVQFGTDRCDYADRLARIAERFVPVATQVGIGIVSYRSSLGRRVSRILDSSRRLQTRAGRKTIAGLLSGAVAVVLAASLIDVGPQPDRAAGAATDVALTPPATDQPKLTPAKEEHGDLVTVRGQVLTAEGRPAVGAKISAIWDVETWDVWYRPIATVNTGPNGLFELVFRKSQFGKSPNRIDEWKGTVIEVQADGCCFEWTYWSKIDATKPLVFKLSPDFPIHGRVVDLQGQPVAGVAVCLLSVSEFRNASLDAWLKRFKGDSQSGAESAPYLGRRRPARDRTDPWAVTNQEGRFVIRGIHAERLITAALRGDSIAYEELSIVTRNTPPVVRGPSSSELLIDKVYGADFIHLASPGRSIVGMVNDAATGKPLPGVAVEVWRMAGTKLEGRGDPRVLTDGNGHYRLIGLPNGKGNQLLLSPGVDQPYLMRQVEVPASSGFEPIKFDIPLHRGLWITGRATDKVTGKPVAAQLYYLPFRENAFARQLPEFHSNRAVDGEDRAKMTREDGTFRIVGLPGRAIVGGSIGSTVVHYRAGVGASEIQGINKNGWFPTYGYFQAGNKWPDVLKEINPREGVEEVRCDLVFDPGATIHVSLIDRNGEPANGSNVVGGWAPHDSSPKPSTFDIVNLSPGEKRPILIRNDQLNIGKFLLLDLTEKTPKSLTITLEPCATIVGRLVGPDGIGVKGSLVGMPRPTGDFWPQLPPVASEPDGNFKVAVPPGCPYGLRADVRGLRTGFTRDLTVEPSKTIDVGEIKLERQRRRR
ncbi:MAG TPA: M56 family metallopeptidase [Planctomycetaceae bacterium]|jgi:beta-lactamase regulating signal transducer with metallopeptidase domain|nr:M56 family metallopeptidase [Planctomycetaceae bacterium]